MSYFPGLKLTKAGEQLLAKVSGNLSETISFRKAELGSGTINSDDEIRFLTALKEKWKDVNISDCKIVGDEQTQVQIELQFDNAGINTNKIFRELGIYAAANDGREVLFAYSNAKENFDYIPAATDNPQSFVINILITITSNTKVNAQIDLNSYVTLRKFNEELAKKLDKGAVSSEYDTAKKIEDKIKTTQGIAKNAWNTANNKLDKGNVSAEYDDAGKIEDKIKEVIKNQWKITPKIIGNQETETDLDDITIHGYYVSETYINKFSHLPNNISGAFSLFVGGIGGDREYYDFQILKDYRNNDMYIRTIWNKTNTDGWTEWEQILNTSSRPFLGSLGIEKIIYIQDVGAKKFGECYLDKVTMKQYRCINTTNDTSITSNFELITNVSIANNLGKRTKELFKGTHIINEETYQKVCDVSPLFKQLIITCNNGVTDSDNSYSFNTFIMPNVENIEFYHLTYGSSSDKQERFDFKVQQGILYCKQKTRGHVANNNAVTSVIGVY